MIISTLMEIMLIVSNVILKSLHFQLKSNTQFITHKIVTETQFLKIGSSSNLRLSVGCLITNLSIECLLGLGFLRIFKPHSTNIFIAFNYLISAPFSKGSRRYLLS